MPEIFSSTDLLGNPATFRDLAPPAILGVFGDPVEHSLSPGFQTAALDACGIKGQYVRLHSSAEQFPHALRALGKAGFVGANVTIPHKAAALAAVDDADEVATRSGGVNTVVVDGDKLLGFSTDGPGLIRAVREEFLVDLHDLRVLLLGAGGGAGRAAAVQCAVEGCERLVLANRTLEKGAALVEELDPYFRSDRLVGPAERLLAIPLTTEALREHIPQVDIIINATPVGMKRTDPSPVPASLLTPNLMVMDMVYAGGKSRLVVDAEAAGARATNGLSMLLHQGALAFEIWFNRPAPLEAMRTKLRADAA
ncbi:MAG: shikimate dehydrogenase [Terrimicrobiaceae bacterium]